MANRLKWDTLEDFTSACLTRIGLPEEDARWTAQVLLRADATDAKTHGLSRLHAYIEAIRGGAICAQPQFRVVSDFQALLALDGDRAPGMVAARRAMREAIERARQFGMGLVTVQNASHAGPMAAYIDIAVQEQMIGMAFSNAQPAIAPWGGAKALYGTNPVAFGAPGLERVPVVIDMATSKVARGNIILAAKEERPIPADWALDADGRATRDAREALQGALLPMADAKGAGLALMVEVLSGVLSGGAFAPEVGSLYNPNVPAGTSVTCLAIDPTRLSGTDSFVTRVDQLTDRIRNTPPAQGYDSVRVPGDRRALLEAQAREDGILLEDSTIQELMELAATLDVPWEG